MVLALILKHKLNAILTKPIQWLLLKLLKTLLNAQWFGLVKTHELLALLSSL